MSAAQLHRCPQGYSHNPFQTLKKAPLLSRSPQLMVLFPPPLASFPVSVSTSPRRSAVLQGRRAGCGTAGCFPAAGQSTREPPCSAVPGGCGLRGRQLRSCKAVSWILVRIFVFGFNNCVSDRNRRVHIRVLGEENLYKQQGLKKKEIAHRWDLRSDAFLV